MDAPPRPAAAINVGRPWAVLLNFQRNPVGERALLLQGTSWVRRGTIAPDGAPPRDLPVRPFAAPPTFDDSQLVRRNTLVQSAAASRGSLRGTRKSGENPALARNRIRASYTLVSRELGDLLPSRRGAAELWL